MIRFQFASLAVVLTIAAGVAGASASEQPKGAGGSEGRHARAITLNGTWEFAFGKRTERAQNRDGQAKLMWRKVNLPGPFVPHSQKVVAETAFVWAKRRFQLTDEQARSLAVLRWNYISLGATAFINGVEVGRNEPIGPYQTIIRPGVLRDGENEIVLKIAGTRGARKARSGFLLFPAGFGRSGDMPSVLDDVWIEFADRAHMKWVLAMPDLAKSKVIIRVTPNGLERLNGLTIRASVRPWPNGDVIGRGQTAARLVPNPDPLGGEHFFVDVPMPNFKPWTHENRNLYLAEVTLLKGKTVLDAVTFRFGMREIKVADRNYKLNGKNLWLRGSNLVFEWH